MTITSSAPGGPLAEPGPAPVVDVVIPVYNEEHTLETCLRRLDAELRSAFPFPYRITVADNASIDGTLVVVQRLSAELPNVTVVHLPEKGRGRALRAVWSASDAEVLAYMDVDLSTDLAGLLPLIAPLVSGHSDLAIGTRLHRGSRVVRGAKREFLSRSYNLILRSTLSARFSDAQCGFKAIRRDVADQLLPLVQDTGWFFDTELLVLAERAGLRIHEVPVDWVDDPDSRVDIVSTAIADLKGVARLIKTFATTQQAIRFAAIGIASTLAYLALFLLMRTELGAQGANLAALLITAIANTAANRRLTFGVRGAHHRGRHQVQGLAVFAVGLALTSGSLKLLHATSQSPDRSTELAVLVLANLTATAVRFVLLRNWVFRSTTALQGGTA